MSQNKNNISIIQDMLLLQQDVQGKMEEFYELNEIISKKHIDIKNKIKEQANMIVDEDKLREQIKKAVESRVNQISEGIVESVLKTITDEVEAKTQEIFDSIDELEKYLNTGASAGTDVAGEDIEQGEEKVSEKDDGEDEVIGEGESIIDEDTGDDKDILDEVDLEKTEKAEETKELEERLEDLIEDDNTEEGEDEDLGSEDMDIDEIKSIIEGDEVDVDNENEEFESVKDLIEDDDADNREEVKEGEDGEDAEEGEKGLDDELLEDKKAFDDIESPEGLEEEIEDILDDEEELMDEIGLEAKEDDSDSEEEDLETLLEDEFGDDVLTTEVKAVKSKQVIEVEEESSEGNEVIIKRKATMESMGQKEIEVGNVKEFIQPEIKINIDNVSADAGSVKAGDVTAGSVAAGDISAGSVIAEGVVQATGKIEAGNVETRGGFNLGAGGAEISVDIDADIKEKAARRKKVVGVDNTKEIEKQLKESADADDIDLEDIEWDTDFLDEEDKALSLFQ